MRTKDALLGYLTRWHDIHAKSSRGPVDMNRADFLLRNGGMSINEVSNDAYLRVIMHTIDYVRAFQPDDEVRTLSAMLEQEREKYNALRLKYNALADPTGP